MCVQKPVRQLHALTKPNLAAEDVGPEEAEHLELHHDDEIGEEVPPTEAQDICHSIVRLVRFLRPRYHGVLSYMAQKRSQPTDAASCASANDLCKKHVAIDDPTLPAPPLAPFRYGIACRILQHDALPSAGQGNGPG